MSQLAAYTPRKCPSHPGDQACYICLDPKCPAPAASGCAHCVREKHFDCKDEFLIEDREFHLKVETHSLQVSEDAIRSDIGRVIDASIAGFRKDLQQLQPVFARTRADLRGLTAEDLHSFPRLKDHFEISFNQKTSDISLRPKAIRSELELAANIDLFKARSALALRSFAHVLNLTDLKVTANSFNVSDWSGHKDIQITPAGSGVSLSRLKEDSGNNYFAAVYLPPVTPGAKFQLTVDQIRDSDRFLDFGIIKKSAISEPYDALTISFNSGGVSFCGYSQSMVEGKMPTSSSSSTEGFKPNDTIYMEFGNPGEVHFYNDDLSVDLVGKNLEQEEEYLVFVVLYYTECACTIDKIS